jgi:hypothetical protein
VTEKSPLRQIEEDLHTIALLRMPDLDSMEAHDKIEALEDHLLETARWRQTLEHGRLVLEDSFEQIDEEWLKLEGWEVFLRGKAKSQVDIDEARREANPDLFFSRRRCIKLMKQIKNQVNRLEKDDAVCSRCYTMLTGS